MNIIELHERVRFWTDTVGSARFDSSNIDNAINTAMNSIVDMKYGNSMISTISGDSFQKTQKIRDELSRLVKKADSDESGSISFESESGSSVVPVASLPSDYRYLLCIAVYDKAGTKYNLWPDTYDSINVREDNPFRKTALTPFPRNYYMESDEGINIFHAFAELSRVVLYYLVSPTPWVYGIEILPATVNLSGTKAIVLSESLLYAGIQYLRGQEFTISNPNFQISSGSAVVSYTNSNINVQLHESIAISAAINLMISIGDTEKVKLLVESLTKIYS